LTTKKKRRIRKEKALPPPRGKRNTIPLSRIDYIGGNNNG